MERHKNVHRELRPLFYVLCFRQWSNAHTSIFNSYIYNRTLTLSGMFSLFFLCILFFRFLIQFFLLNYLLHGITSEKCTQRITSTFLYFCSRQWSIVCNASFNFLFLCIIKTPSANIWFVFQCLDSAYSFPSSTTFCVE